MNGDISFMHDDVSFMHDETLSHETIIKCQWTALDAPKTISKRWFRLLTVHIRHHISQF